MASQRVSELSDSLRGATACHLPGVRDGSATTLAKHRMSSRLDLVLPAVTEAVARSPESVPAIVQAAWALVLRHYTRLDEVCFGYAQVGVAGSGPEEPERTRYVKVNDTLSAEEVLQQVHGKSDEYLHSSTVKSAGNSEQSPVTYNTSIILQVSSGTQNADHAAALNTIVLPDKCIVRVLLQLVDGSLNGSLEWWYPDISAFFASRIAQVYRRMLQTLLCSPRTPISDLVFLTQEDYDRILHWNSKIPVTVDRCIHDIIQDRVRVAPEATAVCSWDGSLTYGELDHLATALATRLIALGVAPEVRVSLCMDKSKWNIVAMLGILKAGGACVPLDPSHPVPRLQMLIQAVNGKLLLCSRRHVLRLEGVAQTVLPVDDGFLSQCQDNSARIPFTANSNNAAYVIFTSGSTGQPKATVVEHKAFCSSAHAHAPVYKIDANARILQFAAHTFDASLIEIFAALMYGACICIPNEEARLNNIAQAINELNVNHATLTPSFVRFLNPSDVPGLRTLVLAGEALSPANIATWTVTKLELMNGYGPTESSVVAAINDRITRNTDHRDIGFPIGVRCWVVDPDNHDVLVPVGCVGELLLEGPTLARGYLNNPDKTRESFIFNPSWAANSSRGSPRRFYKTGDLVRYNSDAGSLSFIGRKDTQVKFHGQRIELGEIESHIAADPDTNHALVLLPKSGPVAQKLVAVVTLADGLVQTPVTPTTLRLLEQPGMKRIIAEIRKRLELVLPEFMVPSVWLCVEALPVLTSNKLDRRSVLQWLETVQQDAIIKAHPGASDVQETKMTDVERRLREIWSYVLNIPLERTSLEHGFLSMGGDSITAMSCMNQCKLSGLGLTVQEILRSKSIRELATSVRLVKRQVDYKEDVEVPFDLSPIQRLHFEVRNDANGHFNQSFFLRVCRDIDETELHSALLQIITRHSMLRARFRYIEAEHKWEQRITMDDAGSYRFNLHNLHSRDQVKEVIAKSQTTLNALTGPVLAVDLFHVPTDGLLLSMIAHHLVVDLVSWRVILEELELLLCQGPSLPGTTLPFQLWCQLQSEFNTSSKQTNADEQVPICDWSFWGMSDLPNVYGDVVCHGFQLDREVTSSLLTEANRPLRTETVDLLVSALLYSFRATFPDRTIPVIYNEGHGREVWDESIDISRTVGWFTTIFPIFAQEAVLSNLIETLIHVKDRRRRAKDNGRAYFTSKLLGEKISETYRQMEITFNFLGRYQQLERKDALFQPVEGLAGETTQGGGAADFARETPRFGLFEISAVVDRDTLRFTFSFNGRIRHQDRIRQWIALCHKTLTEMPSVLASVRPRKTVSDFSAPSMSSTELSAFEARMFPLMGVSSLSSIEDIYGCSPMQQGLMISRTRDPSFYTVRGTYQIKASSGEVDVQKLAQAWQQVVDRHAMLRTVITENVTAGQLYSQIVLREYDCSPSILHCLDERDVISTFDMHPLEISEHKPAHKFSICLTAAGKVFCRLEMSHVIMDGASMSIILKDLELAYSGCLPQNPKPLYSRYISYLETRSEEDSIQFWKSYLVDLEPCHVPPLVDVQATGKEYRSLRLRFGDFRRLRLTCDQNGLTVANTLLAAWALTLRFFTSSEDVCFGYLSSERDVPLDGVDNIVGPMINMVACRASIPSHMTLRQVLRRIQEDFVTSLPYKHTSLATVQHALGLSGAALFNTCFSFRRLPPVEKTRQPSIEFSECAGLHDPTEYAVTLNVETSDMDAVIDLDYWTDNVSDGQAANIAGTFIKAVDNIIENFDAPVGELMFISDENLQQISSWNSHIPNAIDRCIHEVFEQQVELHPNSRAICSKDGDFTYDQVNELSTKLAHYLAGFSVGPETFVAICFEKSAYAVISMLAVLKAGGGCVPLDIGHPKDALEFRAIETGARVVLSSPAHASLLKDAVPCVIPVDTSFLERLPKPDSAILSRANPDNAAFIIFTSGSTGKPKGVVLEHRNLVTSSEAHGNALGIGPESRVLQFASYSFDNSLEEMFTTLMRGGCVCVPTEHDRVNNLAKVINDLNVNFADLTPTVAAFLQPCDVPNLRDLVIGGEALTREIRDTWCDVLTLHNLYGPTECSVNCCHNPGVTVSDDVATIGKAIGSISWVVDPDDHNCLVPIGCVGELLIEGPIVARGYLNNVEKTKESFIENPAFIVKLQEKGMANSSESTVRRMYKTGDLVRYNLDGSIVYFGRKDNQVKLNGQRIELGEIEHRIRAALPSDSHCAVDVVSPSGKGSKALVAFICLNNNTAGARLIIPMSDQFRALAVELKAVLSSQLQRYMVPNFYLPVSAMPMTSSGKLNRRVLRETAQSLLADNAWSYRLGGSHGRPPATESELILQKLWASILGLEPSTISAEDSFFNCGGDSISAIRLVALARQEGYSLGVAEIFKSPKLSDMALKIEGLSAVALGELTSSVEPFSLLNESISLEDLKQETSEICLVPTNAIEDIYPCTPFQEGLIALSNTKPGSYVTRNVYNLPRNVDINRLKTAWQRVAEQEPILRTRVVHTKSGDFYQAVIKQDLEWSSAPDVESLPNSFSQLPQSNGGTLCRFVVVGEDTDCPQFVWIAHHAIYDGWSLPLILHKVKTLYDVENAPDLKTERSFLRFIKHVINVDADQATAFWRERLDGLAAAIFPPSPSPSSKPSPMSQASVSLKLHRSPIPEVTLPSFIRAAWALTISVYSGTDDVIFGEILTGRDAAISGIAEVIGPTLATVPMRIRISGEKRVDEMLRDVQLQATSVISYQFTGLQKIKTISPDAKLACEFQSIFAIAHHDENDARELLHLVDVNSGVHDFFSYSLNVSCTIHGSTLDVQVHYDDKILSSIQLMRIIKHFEIIMSNLSSVNNLDLPVNSLELVGPEDLAQIEAWNRDSTNAVFRCVHDLIDDHTRARPDAMAISAWDGSLTYRMLFEYSTALAHDIRKYAPLRGKETTFIPICFEKSACAAIAMVAILRAGHAFVPIDPRHPTSRRREMIDDVGADLVLCSPRYASLFHDDVKHVLPIDMARLNQLPRATPLELCEVFRPAYVIFTSGSTGKSKGCVIEHAAFCSGALKHGPAFGIKQTSRVLQFASYTFDASILETLTTMVVGGCVCIPDETVRLNNLAKFINDMDVDTAFLTPTMAQMIQPSDVPSLQCLGLVGEPMSPNHLSTWADKVNLVNGYGPTETSVAAAAKQHMTLDTSPFNIGSPIGAAWIVDPNNHNRLVPIGAVGELLVEGPTLSRGYLNNEQKTAEAFITNPTWSSTTSSNNRRMYKTGDLVKYAPDNSGELLYVGRKDRQAKLHGQRFEIEEIEHHLNADRRILNVCVALPTRGQCEKRLVAVLSLREFDDGASDFQEMALVTTKHGRQALRLVQERLRGLLPAFMVPSVWIITRQLPLLPSGKLDRRKINRFLEDIDDETYQKIMTVEELTEFNNSVVVITETEARLRAIWASVLKMPTEKINLDTSFIHLGGDSISAMAVASKCRHEGIGITVENIITCESIRQLASLVKQPKMEAVDEENDCEFDLSPIQSLYFKCMQAQTTQFNQSMLLQIKRPVSEGSLRTALSTLVNTHSMLRARFIRDANGVWKQYILRDIGGSYLFYSFSSHRPEDLSLEIEMAQKQVNVVDGPAFVAVLFEHSEMAQLFICAHHLVVDMVSWSVIVQDLNDLLQEKHITRGMSYQKWCQGLKEYAKRSRSVQALPLDDVPVADLAYWGMEGLTNHHGDVTVEEVKLDLVATDRLLSATQELLQVDIVDVLLGVLLVSFTHAFPDRPTPAIYNEGHGREPCIGDIDLSRTVGWFTTLSPVHLPPQVMIKDDLDLLKSIIWIHDLRRRMPEKGASYFAQRFLTWDGSQKYGHHWPMEIMFNYLGQHKKSDDANVILEPVDGTGQAINAHFDIGSRVPRFALIDVSAAVIQGSLVLLFSYNKSMRRQAGIQQWIVDCHHALCSIPGHAELGAFRVHPEVYRLLPLSFGGLWKIKDALANAGITSLENVEAIYPCTPMQQGILLSQLRDPQTYSYRATFEVRPPHNHGSIDVNQLEEAWNVVIRRHAALRTVFVEGTHGMSLMDQVVLKETRARVLHRIASTEDDAYSILSTFERLNFRDGQPPHRFIICRSETGKVICRLDITNALFDGSSMPIILRDLSRAYVNLPPAIPDIPLYKSFVAYLQSLPKEKGVAYWRQYLKGTEPCQFPSLAGSNSERVLGSHSITLTDDFAKMQNYCRTVGITSSALLQLAWGLVLRCYIGSDEICFGYITSGRDVPVQGIEYAVGAFINMLIYRAILKDDILVQDALKTAQQDFVKSMEYQYVSLAEVQHDLGLSETSLFDTVFTLQRRDLVEEGNLPALSFEPFYADDPSEYKLGINVEMTPSVIEVHFTYWTDHLSQESVEFIADTFSHIVASIIRTNRPDLRLKDIDSFGNRSCVSISRWNNILPEAIDRCVHEVIEEQVASQPPTAKAIEAWDGSFTYRDLSAKSSRLASFLSQQGVGPEVFVPLLFEKSAWIIVAQLAVLKAGGAFVSLDPSHPEDRLRSLIRDVNACVVLTSRKQQAKISKVCNSVVTVDEELMERLPEIGLASTTPAKPSSAAYIIFTSGSTGKPKGTIIEHSQLCTSSFAHGNALQMNTGTRTLQFASYAFDASVMEIMTTLMQGGCVCVPSEEERLNDIASALKKYQANWMLLTPSLANTLKPENMSGLDVLVMGGEKLTQTSIERWSKSVNLYAAYGPSECAVVSCSSEKVAADGTVVNSEAANIGKAVGCRAWIVDPRDYNRLVPVGAIGELLIEGPIVGRGYLHDEKTNESFVHDPHWSQREAFRGIIQPGSPMYRTGDLVRYNPDGTITYLTRADRQVKINGQRIEIGEIEFQCTQHLPDHSQVAVDVVALDSQFGARKLAMFFVLPVDSEPQLDGRLLLPMNPLFHATLQKLEKSLADILPSYMLPQFFFPVASLPVTSSGKLDRRKLHEEVKTLSEDSIKSYSLLTAIKRHAPTDKMQRTLQGLWAAVLSIPESAIGVEDSFFRLGGDSLAAMRLVALARSNEIALSVVDIFQTPTLKDMAEACQSAAGEHELQLEPFALLKGVDSLDELLNEVTSQIAVHRTEIADIYPCSPLQEGLITLSLRQRGAYVAQHVFKLADDVDLNRFQAAWQQLVDELDLLRTRIIHTASTNFVQVVLKEQNITWHTADRLSDISRDRMRVPETEGAPLSRFTIVHDQRSNARYFVWLIHHALYDAWGLSILLKRVEDIYWNRALKSRVTSYASFINYLQQRDVSASDQFWKSYLEGASPVAFPRATNSSSDKGSEQKTISDTSELSQSALSSLDITMPALIRAAWAIVLFNRTGSDDVCFGETLIGRNVDVQGVTEIAGPVLTTVPTRIRVDPEMEMHEFLLEAHRKSTEMIPHQHSGLQHIRRLSQGAALACDFQNLLDVQTVQDGFDDELWEVKEDEVIGNFFTYPLVVECKVRNTNVEIIMHYDANTISTWEGERLLKQFSHILQQLSSASRAEPRKVGQVDIISPEDKEEISWWNRREPQLVDKCIHEIFHSQSLFRPDSPAVDSWDDKLTYAELEAHASSLAVYLKQLGVGPEVFVPLCLDKSAWTIVAMLAVLIAGGAFVPLDPNHPLSRHLEIFEELRASIVLVSEQHYSRYQGKVRHLVSIDKHMIQRLPFTSILFDQLGEATSSNAAYAIFTSGSTGKAKGITIEHRAFVSSSMAFGPTTRIDSNCRVLQFASLSFDAAVMEILSTLTLGGCVCVPSEDERLTNLAEAIQRMNVSWALLTPSVANLLDASTVPCLKVLVCGGEAMSPETISRWSGKVSLINAYGPSEASVVATVNPDVSSQQPACIGYGTQPTLTWVVDPEDCNTLTPLGAVGELALEGPTLARGYLNDEAKTRAAFVENPAWATSFPSKSGRGRRIHLTGDLVKYNPDGSLEYVGRKDNQVKLNGQRLDLGEVEHRLETDPRVRHVVVTMPKVGPFKKRLIAILSINAMSSDKTVLSVNSCELVENSPKLNSELTEIKARLSSQLPSYMVPQAWAVVNNLPMLVSGKLDRKKVKTWVEGVQEEVYQRIIGVGARNQPSQSDNDITADGVTAILRELWSQVLNIPVENVKLDQSFLSQGGDSITAMAVVSRGRRHNLKLTLHDILTSSSIMHLASTVESAVVTVEEEEKVDEPFGLSPIQQVYFQAATDYHGRSRFNQSFSLRLTRYIEPETLGSAVKAVVAQHSMLRARFRRSSDGHWEQWISSEPWHGYQVHRVKSTREVPALMGQSQASLNIFEGPVFLADLFEIESHDQILFMVAHHLCVDIVSWRIVIQDLTDYLESGSLVGGKPLSFQAWCSLQTEHVKRDVDGGQLPFKVIPANVGYWGMDGVPNTFETAEQETFTLGEDITAMVMTDCHDALRTEPVDIFLSAILLSFRRVFDDRYLPTLYNESHGREAWDSDHDPSRTVGWFTNIAPLQVTLETDDILDAVRRVKDVRRSAAENAKRYLAHRFLSPDERFREARSDVPMEILFNYLGAMQHLERDDSLFQNIEVAENKSEAITSADMGPHTPRLALFDISAIVQRGKLEFSFTYNTRMRRANDIPRWASECKHLLGEIAAELKESQPRPTLSDYPLLPINYDDLRRLFEESLPEAGVNPAQLEDIYPCSPTQEGMLLSQFRDSSTYYFHASFEVKPAIPSDATLAVEEVNPKRLLQSWQKVVDRHAALRTVFINSPYRGGSLDQAVLRTVDSGGIYIECDDSVMHTRLKAISLYERNRSGEQLLPHQVTVCKTSTGRVIVKIEINHAIIDGGSIRILLRDLSLAYDGRLPDGRGPLYSDYIRYMKSKSATEDVAYWTKYLQGIQMCHLPLRESKSERRQATHTMAFDQWPELLRYCEKTGVTLANVIQAAWALVLRKYTGSDDVCFGYLSAGRDAPVNGIQEAIGVFITLLCCRVRINPSETLAEIPSRVQKDYLSGISHQRCSLAQVQHELGLQGKQLFNTALSIQNHTESGDGSGDDSLIFLARSAQDPSEFALSLNIETRKGDEAVLFRFWTDMFSAAQVAAISDDLAKCLAAFIDDPMEIVSQVDFDAIIRRRKASSEPQTSNQGYDQGQSLQQLLASEELREFIDERIRTVVREVLSHIGLPSNNGLVTEAVTRNLADVTNETPPDADVSSTLSESSNKDDVDSDATDTGPQSRRLEIEQRLLRLWSQKLGLPPESISRSDSFFRLGADSITAMGLVGDARDEGLVLTVADVFRNPVFEDMVGIIHSASELSYMIDANLNNSDGQATSLMANTDMYERFALLKAANIDDAFLQQYICPRVGVFRGGFADILPVTDFQALALTGSLLESRWMLNYFYFDGRGPLDIRRLKNSCFRVVQAFDILRTVFVASKGRFLQVILRKLRPEFTVYETSESLDEFTAVLQRQDVENGIRQGGPFVRFIVLKAKNTDQHRILIRLSHAQYDGVCLPRILSAIKAGYEGGPIPSTASFANYVRETARQVTSDHYEHWRSLLNGSRMLEVVRRQEPNCRTARGSRQTLKQTARVPSMANGNITTATVIKAAWALTMARITGTSDVVFGHTISGRNTPGISGVETMVGPCINVVPVRVQLRDGWTALDLVRHIQDQQVANMPYEMLGFRQIIKECTDWPNWTNFTTLTQHDSAALTNEIQLGENTYQIKGMGSDEDLADFSLNSRSIDREQVEIVLSFSPEEGISSSLAERVLHMVCDVAETITRNPGMALPSPDALASLPTQHIQGRIGLLDDRAFRVSQLSRLNQTEVVILSDIVRRTWEEVLYDAKQPPLIKSDSSFFDLGGDLVGLAQVAWLLEQEKFKVRLDDLIEHPTLAGQMAVIVQSNAMVPETKQQKKTADKLSAETVATVTSSAVECPDAAPMRPVKPKRTASWATAVDFARRIVWRREG